MNTEVYTALYLDKVGWWRWLGEMGGGMKYLMEEGEGSNCPGNVRQIWCGGLISDGSFQFHPTAVCWCVCVCVVCVCVSVSVVCVCV